MPAREFTQTFERYAAEIDLSPTGTYNLLGLLEIASELQMEEPLDLLITDVAPPDAPRAFTSALVFSKNYIYEFKDFLSGFNWDATPLRDLYYVNIIANNFDMHTAVTSSSMVIIMKFRDGMDCAWRGGYKNCLHAVEVFKKHIAPRLSVDQQPLGQAPVRG